MSRFSSIAESVARSVLCGAFDEASVTEALGRARGRPLKSLAALAAKLIRTFGSGRRPRLHAVAAFLDDTGAFRRAFRAMNALPDPGAEPGMQPCAGPPQHWILPALTTPAALAEWLAISPQELLALAARWRVEGETRMHHYHFHWIARRRGLPRLIEAPKQRLKTVQRRILTGILENIPPHPAAHGFRSGRNIVGFTASHAGQHCVLRMDVQDFFSSLRRPRVLRVFLNAGYPEPVAALLADLCTTVTPAAVRHAMPGAPPDKAWPLRKKLQGRHLPQGAPTSPALANLCAFSLDTRLSGLAKKFHARYTRYADDLLFSGGDDFARAAGRCEVHAAAILLETGLAAAHRKTKIMPQSVSQRAAGLVLNVRPGLPRRERDRLKAILTNCLRHGPASQNSGAHPDFRAHLLGRLSHAACTHPASAAKLRALFDRIPWQEFACSSGPVAG
jgi:RNA-directed DNA polymerase